MGRVGSADGSTGAAAGRGVDDTCVSAVDGRSEQADPTTTTQINDAATRMTVETRAPGRTWVAAYKRSRASQQQRTSDDDHSACLFAMRIDLRARSILCYSDAAMVDQDAVQSRVGTTLRGKYHLERVIGVGGMAAVYEATHRNGKRFAIKILHAHLAERDDTRRRFVREGYVANAVDHPGAVSVLDDDVGDDGAAFLVMELLVGEALDQLWKEQDRRFALPVVVEVARQLLAVLASAHAHSIVHRDIKPANLFVTRDGTLKVLDFGIARVRDATIGDASLTG